MSAAELNTRLFDDVKKISNGIGDKVGVAVQGMFIIQNKLLIINKIIYIQYL